MEMKDIENSAILRRAWPRIALLLASAIGLLACDPTEPLRPTGPSPRASLLLVHNETPLWPRFGGPINIPVCWQSPGFDVQKRQIRLAVTRTWGRVAPLNFVGWETCPAVPVALVRMEVIQATDLQGGASTRGKGTNTLHFPSQGPSVTFNLDGATAVDRVRYLGVHEFGHVLGFEHEDDSPERAPNCASQPPWTNVTQVGAWDRSSIMNSGCNVYGNGLGYLSAGDVAAVRRIYGTRQVVNQGDFNGDASVDLGVWRPSSGTWYIPAQIDTKWGVQSDVVVPGDYDGDGTTNRAVWRPSTGVWYVNDRITPPTQLGQRGDLPVPADYDGDGKTDFAVWRPSTGTWYIRAALTRVVQWGQPGDVPVPGDYDGDGCADVAVWRPSTGRWHIALDGGKYDATWGQPGDVPIPGDYVGEGKVRVAVWRPSTGQWWFTVKPLMYSGTVMLGRSGDVPFAGSLSGNGIWEVGVWRPSTGTFLLPGGWSRRFGQNGDVPLPKTRM